MVPNRNEVQKTLFKQMPAIYVTFAITKSIDGWFKYKVGNCFSLSLIQICDNEVSPMCLLGVILSWNISALGRLVHSVCRK